MVIIVEGIDRVGKTTFCEKLHGKTGIPVFREPVDFSLWKNKSGNEVREIMVEKMLSILSVVKTIECDIIFDRFHLSEFVYGNLERGAIVELGIKNVDELLKELEAKIILFHPIDIEQVNNEHGKDLTEHERVFSSLISKCDIINCTYYDIDVLVNNLSNEYHNEVMKRYECGFEQENEEWGF